MSNRLLLDLTQIVMGETSDDQLGLSGVIECFSLHFGLDNQLDQGTAILPLVIRKRVDSTSPRLMEMLVYRKAVLARLLYTQPAPNGSEMIYHSLEIRSGRIALIEHVKEFVGEDLPQERVWEDVTIHVQDMEVKHLIGGLIFDYQLPSSDTPPPSSTTSPSDSGTTDTSSDSSVQSAAGTPRPPIWKDLAQPRKQTQELRSIYDDLKARDLRTLRRASGDGQSAGSGVSILFAGPSGTGKTKAVDMIAGALSRDLVHIDLSKDKADPQQTLSRVFQAAEASSDILLLSEADALVEQRTGVQDAHDRYANLETNFLLQRLETFEGIVFITTNDSSKVTPALRRQLDYVVEFTVSEQTVSDSDEDTDE